MNNGFTWIVGDIHGELDKLEQVLKIAPIQKRDRIIFLGDYIDRGSKSFHVIQKLIELSKEYDCVFLKGNHDDSFTKQLCYGEFNPLWSHGGKETFFSYKENNGFANEEHKQFFLSLKSYFIDEENDLFIHAGFNRHKTLDEIINNGEEWIFYWDRDLWMSAIGWYYLSEENKKEHSFKIKEKFRNIYIGHTATILYDITVPMQISNIINLDTGSGKGGKLTIYCKDTKEFYQST